MVYRFLSISLLSVASGGDGQRQLKKNSQCSFFKLVPFASSLPPTASMPHFGLLNISCKASKSSQASLKGSFVFFGVGLYKELIDNQTP